MDTPTALRPPAAAGGGQSAANAAGVETPSRHRGTEESRSLAVPVDPGGDRTSAQAGGRGVAAPGRSSTTRRYLGALVSLAASLAVVTLAAVAVALTLVPALVGGHALTVLSPSMVPALPPGSVLVDRPVAADSVRVGDVITYATTDEVSGVPILITHRVVAIESNSAGPTFITQGDANNAADDRPVEGAQIRGKVWYHVPYIGVARNFLLAQGAGLILGGVVALVAAVWFLVHLMRSDSKPAQNATESGIEPQQPGRHRARNSAVGTALAGVLVTSAHLVTHTPGTLSQFSDQQSVHFEITLGTADPAQ
jgi:signal peptidase